jgi:RNA polymerase sigma factor (sigma-70 family)
MSDIALSANGVPALPRAERLLGDERLAKLAGHGSERAFAVLYERHHQAIYRYCRSIVGNDHDAQDALQSAMMRAYAALGRQQHDLAVKPWLFRIAHNEAVSILRRRRPDQALSDGLEQRGDSVEGAVDVRERLSTLFADLGSLPERQRAALVMRELSGLSIAEIAQALSISPGAAKQTVFEARSSLHELAEGRAMQCEAVRAAISERDGRVLRGRRIRAHLRSCEGCRTFRAAIGERRAELRALAPPLPAAAASAILMRLLARGGGGHAGGAVATGYGTAAVGSGSSVGGHAAAASLLAKGLAGVAVVAAATAGAINVIGRHDRVSGAAGISSAAGRSTTFNRAGAASHEQPDGSGQGAARAAGEAGIARRGAPAAGRESAAASQAGNSHAGRAFGFAHRLGLSLGPAGPQRQAATRHTPAASHRVPSGDRHARQPTAGRRPASQVHRKRPARALAHRRPSGSHTGRRSPVIRKSASEGSGNVQARGTSHAPSARPTHSEPQPTTSTPARPPTAHVSG